MENNCRLYSDLAWLWPLWGTAEDYADFCTHAIRLVREHAQVRVRSLLNIGCGGGKNVYNLKQQFEVTGVDLSAEMLSLAKDLNPECEFLQGDMRTLSLGRTFDAILLDDAVSCMRSRKDLLSAFETAWRHLCPGGVMIVVPDETKETFLQNHTESTVGKSAGESPVREVVFVENCYDPDPKDSHYETTMVYLIREEGRLRVETDRHVLGIFSLQEWRELLAAAGFAVQEEGYVESGKSYVVFACLKPR